MKVSKKQQAAWDKKNQDRMNGHVSNNLEHKMDQVLKVIPGVGEAGLDTDASPGNGQFYVRLYDGSYDVCGYDTIEEAIEELVDAASV